MTTRPPKPGVLDHLLPPVGGGRPAAQSNTAQADTRTAWAHFKAGRLAEAEQLGRRLLAHAPGHQELLHLLGLVAFRSGKLPDALQFLDRALAAASKNPTLHMHRGIVLGAADRLSEASDAFRAALKLRPDFADAHYNLGLALIKRQDRAGSIAAFRQAVRDQPRHLWAHHNLAMALLQAGEWDAAAEACRAALAIEPRFVEAYENLATIFHEQGRPHDATEAVQKGLRLRETAPLRYALGRVDEAAGRLDTAATHYRRAMELDPKMLGPRVNLGNVLRDLARDDESWALNTESVRLHPDSPGVLNNYALSLLACTRAPVPPAPIEELHAAALNAIRKAVALAPKDADIQFTHAAVLNNMDRDGEALEVLDSLTAAHPDMVNAQHTRRVIQLRQGKDNEGRDAFSWYWKLAVSQTNRRPFSEPAWEGQAIPPGRRLLVWADQGVGDEIVNLGFVPALAQRSIDAVLECDPRLVDIARRSWPSLRIVGRSNPPDPAITDIAYQCPLSQLMAWLGPWPNSFPRHPRYLTPDAERVRSARIGLEAAGLNGLKVGLSWRSQRAARALQRVQKSIELLTWEPILTQAGANFVNLQYDETADDIALVQDRLGVAIHTVPGLDRRNDIDGMMALIAGLDLVITISNVTAHYAGAVGTPCWVMVRKAPFWYWRKDGDRAAIYKSIRILRQAGTDDGTGAIGQAADGLRRRLATRPA